MALKPVKTFRILPVEVEGSVVRLRYAFDETYFFTETYDFGVVIPALEGVRKAGFFAALRGLSVAAGISYYKAFCPPEMVVEGWALAPWEAQFFGDFYAQGLGEFAARGGHDLLSLDQKVRMKGTVSEPDVAGVAGLKARSLVMVGGGKDSLVTVEALRAADHEMTLLAIKAAKPIVDCMEVSGLPSMKVVRTLDPLLFELNAAGAMNGHVPITGILSFAAVAAAMAFDYDAVVFSNERSASEATAVYQGVAVNHQYSKSIEAERAIQEYVRRYVAADLRVFSFLRPLSEMQIAALFAEHDLYDDVFTSCNRAYKINGAAEERWCCDCPKCFFVYLALATAMPKDRLVGIFGKDVLADKRNVEGFAALCGLKEQKPWECVGEVREAAGAVGRLSELAEWQESAVVQELLPKLEAKHGDLRAAWGEAMTLMEVEDYPAEFLGALSRALAGR